MAGVYFDDDEAGIVLFRRWSRTLSCLYIGLDDIVLTRTGIDMMSCWMELIPEKLKVKTNDNMESIQDASLKGKAN